MSRRLPHHPTPKVGKAFDRAAVFLYNTAVTSLSRCGLHRQVHPLVTTAGEFPMVLRTAPRHCGLVRWCWAAALLAAMLAPAAAGYADDFDWNNIAVSGGTYSFVTPVKNQTVPNPNAGTCWAFASVAALESRYMITRDDPTYQPDLSEEMLIDSGSAGSVSGGYVGQAMNYLVNTGVVTEATLLYTGTNGPTGWTMPPSWQSQLCVAVSDTTDFTAATATIKADLKTYGPIVAQLYADNDFYPPGTRSGLACPLDHRLP